MKKQSAAQKQSAAKKPMAAKKQSAAQSLIMIVEDYDDAREMYRRRLEFAGYRVIDTRDGAEALATALEHRPDLILMDIALPKMDGLEVTRRLRLDPRTKGAMIVALTGHALPNHEREAAEAGCDAFISKPCLPDDLVKRVEQLLRGRRRSRREPSSD